MSHPPAPLTSTTLSSQNGVVTSLHITSPLNKNHRIFISLDTPSLLVLDSQCKNEKSVDISEGTTWSITSHEDKWIATGSTSAELSVYNLRTLNKTHTLLGHTSTIRAIKVLSPTSLISSSRDTTIRIWDISSTQNPTCTAILEGHTATIRSLSISGKYLISGAYENDARVWDLESNECLRILKGPTQEEKVYVVASAEGVAVTGGMNSVARVWDLISGNLLATLPCQNLITQIIILPALILTANNQGTFQTWSRETYTKLHEVKAHESSIVSMECDSLGRRVVTGSSDGSVKVWDLETGTLVMWLVNSEAVWSVGWVDDRRVVGVYKWVGDVVVETWENSIFKLDK